MVETEKRATVSVNWIMIFIGGGQVGCAYRIQYVQHIITRSPNYGNEHLSGFQVHVILQAGIQSKHFRQIWYIYIRTYIIIIPPAYVHFVYMYCTFSYTNVLNYQLGHLLMTDGGVKRSGRLRCSTVML